MSSWKHQSTFGRQTANTKNQPLDEEHRFENKDRFEQSRSRKRQLDSEDMSSPKRQCSFGRQTTNSWKRPRYEDSYHEKENSDLRHGYDSRKREPREWQEKPRNRQTNNGELSWRKRTSSFGRETTNQRIRYSSRADRQYSCRDVKEYSRRADRDSSSHRPRSRDSRRNEPRQWQKDARRRQSEHRESHSRKPHYSSGRSTTNEEIKPLEEVIFFDDRKSTGVIDADDLQEQKPGPMSEWQKEKRKKLLDYEAPSREEPEKKQFDSHRCYNCMGKLNFADCQKEKDYEARISRQAFLDAPRYKPGGEISDKLRKALGLGDREIPEYIYRMRKLGFVKGYPPGYLKQAFQEVETVKFITEDPYFDKKDVDKPTPVPIIKNSKIHGYIGFNKHNQSLYGHSDRHQIPPFAVYCQMLQNEVERQHEDAQEKQREQSKKEKNTHNADQQLLQVAPKKEVVGEKDLQSRVIQENAPSALMGSSMSQIIGTPVFPVKGSLKPLEDFAKGILPFERNEEVVVKRGLFDDIMKIIKDKKRA